LHSASIREILGEVGFEPTTKGLRGSKTDYLSIRRILTPFGMDFCHVLARILAIRSKGVEKDQCDAGVAETQAIVKSLDSQDAQLIAEEAPQWEITHGIAEIGWIID